MIRFDINIKIYRTYVEFYVTRDGEKAAAAIEARQKMKLSDTSAAAFRTGAGVTYADPTEVYPLAVWLPPNASVEEVAHELQHVLAAVMRASGIPLTEDTEEAYAFLSGYLTKRYYRNLKRQKRNKRDEQETNAGAYR